MGGGQVRPTNASGTGAISWERVWEGVKDFALGGLMFTGCGRLGRAAIEGMERVYPLVGKARSAFIETADLVASAAALQAKTGGTLYDNAVFLASMRFADSAGEFFKALATKTQQRPADGGVGDPDKK